jgi:hypothetical protein
MVHKAQSPVGTMGAQTVLHNKQLPTNTGCESQGVNHGCCQRVSGRQPAAQCRARGVPCTNRTAETHCQGLHAAVLMLEYTTRFLCSWLVSEGMG